MAHVKDVEDCMMALEKALGKMKAAEGSMVKLQKAEVDMMACVQKSRDLIMGLIQDKNDKDRSNLIECFGGDCVRIAKFRGVLEASVFSEKYKDDTRLSEGKSAIKLVEDILREKNYGNALDEAQRRCIPWRPSGTTEGSVQAPAPKPAPAEAPAPQPAPAEAPPPEPVPAPAAQPSTKSAEPLPASTLAAPKSTEKVIVTHEGEKAPEGAGEKRNISVQMSIEVQPEVTPNQDGSITVALPTVKVTLATSSSPEWPADAKPFLPSQEFTVPVPEFEKAGFDPAKKIPRLESVVLQHAELLEIPGDLEVGISSKAISPWGSVVIKNGQEETNVHHTAIIAGAFAMEDGADSRMLSINLKCTVILMLSGEGSAKFTPDGVPLAKPEHYAS